MEHRFTICFSSYKTEPEFLEPEIGTKHSASPKQPTPDPVLPEPVPDFQEPHKQPHQKPLEQPHPEESLQDEQQEQPQNEAADAAPAPDQQEDRPGQTLRFNGTFKIVDNKFTLHVEGQDEQCSIM